MTREMLLKKATGEAARPRSHFKRTGTGHCFRRLRQSAGKTLGTRAEFAQIFESINAGLVAVAPGKIERIVSHRRNAGALDCRRDVSMADFPFSRKLLDAFGAHAVFPQIPGRVRAEVAIVPCDIGLFRTNALHKLRHDVRQ